MFGWINKTAIIVYNLKNRVCSKNRRKKMLFSYDVHNFMYIAVIILNGISFVLTLILNAREKDEKHKALYMFAAAVFVFMIIDFTVYYFLEGSASGGVIFAMITVSDIMFCAVITAWVYLIIVQADMKSKISLKPVIIMSVIYAVMSQILSIALGRYASFTLHVQNGAGKIMLQVLNTAYSFIIIMIGIVCAVAILKSFKNTAGQKTNFVLSVVLIGYMIWIIYWDYSVWFRTEDNLASVYGGDPLILISGIFAAALIYYFYKKDPLRVREKDIASVDAIVVISEKYGLTEREKEVISLLNSGFSNPQIAERLFISENTVKRHINNIFKKTKTSSRHEVLFKIANINKLNI